MTCTRSLDVQPHAIIVHRLKPADSTDLWEAIFAWFQTDEAVGHWHGYWLATTDMRHEKFRISFSDANTAFAFKMRFC